MNKNFRTHHEKFYNRYAYIAVVMASKVNRLDALGLEREDIQQELRLKIWTAIPEYLKKWKEYLKGGTKPVPMRFYLSNVVSNKIKDYYKYIDREKGNIRMSEISFDYSIGQESVDTFVDFENCEIVLCGVDVMRGMEANERKAFVQYVKGHKLDNIEKIYGKKVKNVREVIGEQVKFLRNYHSDLVESREEFYVLDYSNREN